MRYFPLERILHMVTASLMRDLISEIDTAVILSWILIIDEGYMLMIK